MDRDIDQMTFELVKTMAENKANLNKALPPKLRYRIRKWLEKLGMKGMSTKQAQQFVAQKMEEEIILRSLKKNEALVSFYNDRTVKLDFGSNVSAAARKAALSWAKKRGLKPVEVSLTKSATPTEQIILAPENTSSNLTAVCLRRIRFKADA